MTPDAPAMTVPRYGGPDVLELGATAVLAPGPGELLVDVAAIGVNYRDTLERRGLLPDRVPVFVAGVEGAGRVRAVGSGVAGFRAGDRVAWFQHPGSYAATVLVPAQVAVAVPYAVDDETAAALLMQGMTAHHMATGWPVGSGTALVHSAAGGVGLMLTQMISMLGGRVIGTVSGRDKVEVARTAGADAVLVRGDIDLVDEVLRLTDGEGVAAVYDGIGRDTFEDGIRALRPKGVMAVYGIASGPVEPIDLLKLPRSIAVCRPSAQVHAAMRDQLVAHAGQLFDWVARGKLSVHVGNRYPLGDAGRAHADLESRATTGKLVIIPE